MRGYIDCGVYHYEGKGICCNINTDFSEVEEIDFHYQVGTVFNNRESVIA